MSIEAMLAALPDEWRPSEPDLIPIQGGRNNRVYRFRTAKGLDCIAKLYHGVPVDEATRLRREFSFLRLMRDGGIRCVPEMLHADFEEHLALFPFVPGTKPPEGWQEPWGVEQAVGFLRRLVTLRDHPNSHEVPDASEACFSLKDHATALRKRLDRLKSIEQSDACSKEAHDFFEHELRPVCKQIVFQIESQPGSDRELTPEEKWLSPSDFGFHNTLISNDREMKFLDFEHAGWDDPAKLIADFCNQPDHLLNDSLATLAKDNLCKLGSDSGGLRKRVEILTPLYQAKWACILLNEFLPFGNERRNFLGRSPDESAAEKRRQLSRSREMLRRAKSAPSSEQ